MRAECRFEGSERSEVVERDMVHIPGGAFRMGSASYDPDQLRVHVPPKVLKGSSHLSAPNYCRSYRPAARQAHPIDTATSLIGFRRVIRGPRS